MKPEINKEKRKKNKEKSQPEKSRSRSREDEKNLENKLKKEKEELKKKWDTTNSFTEQQNSKFMRLMGGYKGGDSGMGVTGAEVRNNEPQEDECKKIDVDVIQKNKNMQDELETQFNFGMQMRLGNRGGLGFGN